MGREVSESCVDSVITKMVSTYCNKFYATKPELAARRIEAIGYQVGLQLSESEMVKVRRWQMSWVVVLVPSIWLIASLGKRLAIWKLNSHPKAAESLLSKVPIYIKERFCIWRTDKVIRIKA